MSDAWHCRWGRQYGNMLLRPPDLVYPVRLPFTLSHHQNKPFAVLSSHPNVPSRSSEGSCSQSASLLVTRTIRRITANRNVVLGWFIRLIAKHILTKILLHPSTSFMDGVSSASAIIAIAQVGFNLAQTLNTYITDVKNGRSDIANLANEIDATATHIEELDKMIQENSITNGWNANGLKIAKQCSTDFERTLNQLRAVFSKTGAALISSTFMRDDIDISIFNRLTWPHKRPV
jgi:hypothetical protein